MQPENASQLPPIRVAVAQIPGSQDPSTESIAGNAHAIRAEMRAAREAGARLVQFHEGALSGYPSKKLMSGSGLDIIGEADWSKVAWGVLDREFSGICELARELGIWVVLGSLHRFSRNRRPCNSLLIVSDRGQLAGRYDKRFLSFTEISHMYTPGRRAQTFTVDGWTFGCAICIEINYPELFLEYERLDVDCVLFSTYSEDSMFGIEAQGHAAGNSFWVTFSPPTQGAEAVPAGLIAPNGTWIRQANNSQPQCVIVDLDQNAPEAEKSVKCRRPWRRAAREGSIYREHYAPE
ncbi:MAG: carbon-nitrogen hydrolase family protein [Spirochaetaceae bacterium]|nr:MAG: carbon-nitrogen hydrolase family protein [Spirochaetaceae bacterium]